MSWKWWIKPPSPERNIPAEQLRRAHAAKSALPVTREAFADVRAALLDQLVQSGPADAALREYYYQAVKGLDAIMATTEVYANHGDIAEAMDTYKKKVLNQ